MGQPQIRLRSAQTPGSVLNERIASILNRRRPQLREKGHFDMPASGSYGGSGGGAGGGSGDPIFPEAGTYEKCYADSATVSGFTAGELVDGARTTWTLPTLPVTNSVLLFNNGQQLHEGVHYTRSGTGITVSFAPVGELTAVYAEAS